MATATHRRPLASSASVPVQPGMHTLPRRRPIIPPTEWAPGSSGRTAWAADRPSRLLRTSHPARPFPAATHPPGLNDRRGNETSPAPAFRRKHRLLWRVPAVLVLAGLALADLLVCVWLVGGQRASPRRGLWAENWSRKFLRLLGVRVHTRGEPPHHGLMVANHPSPLDHLVLASRQPLVFAPGASLEGSVATNPAHPLSGPATPSLATLSDQVVAVFPEAGPPRETGAAPFLPARLAFASTGTMTAIPVHLAYLTRDGQSAARQLVPAVPGGWSAWWTLLQQPPLEVRVTYGLPVSENGNRTLWARRLREAVLALENAPAAAVTPHDPATATGSNQAPPPESAVALAAKPSPL